VDIIKYKSPKAVAHAPRAPQLLVLGFYYVHLLSSVGRREGRNLGDEDEEETNWQSV